MNKMYAVILFACVLFGSVSAADQPSGKKTPKTTPSVPFSRIWNSSLTPEKINSIRSFKLTYQGVGDKIKENIIVIRCQKRGIVRMDVHYKNNLYTACCNDGKSWNYTNKDGASLLNKEDTLEMARDFSLLQIPCMPRESYARPRFIKTEKADDVNCKLYESKPLDGTAQVIRIWVEEKNNLVYQAEVENGNGIMCMAFRDYKDYDGIKLASRITLSDDDKALRMQLSSVKWNVKLPNHVFIPAKEDLSKEALAFIQSKKAGQERLKNPEKSGKDAIAKVKRKINVLQVEINEYENQLQVLEKTINSNKNDMVHLSSTPSSSRSYRSVWNSGVYYSGGSSSKRSRKKVIRALSEETDAAKSRYIAIRKKLTQKRIQLEDAKAELEKLQQ